MWSHSFGGASSGGRIRRGGRIAALAAVVGLAGSAFGTTQTSTWIGGSTAWNDPNNWSPNNAFPNNGNGGISDFDVVVAPAAQEPVVNVNSTIDTLSVNANATLTLGAAITLNVAGPTVTNNGTIVIDVLSSNADLNFTGNTTISGTGTIKLNDFNPSARITSAVNVTVTTGAGQTIDGVGDIDAALINNGVVNADFSGHTIALQTSNMTNNNVFEASPGGTLTISGITVTQGANGTIAAAGGTISISNTTIIGGTLSGATSMTLASSNLTGVGIAAGTTVLIAPGTTVNYTGPTLVNNGEIEISNVGAPSILNFTSNTLITGNGTVLLNTYSPDAEITASPNATVTNDVSSTIAGIGDIDAPLINNGIVNANSTIGTHTILLQTSNMTNNHLMEATNGGILNINGITITQGPSGVILNSNATVTMSGATINGGLLSGLSFSVSNSNFTNVTIDTGTVVTIQAGTTLNYTGATFTNNGTINVDVFSSNATLNFTGNTTLTGTGSVFLDDFSPNASIKTSANATLTNNQTIFGIGEIDAAMINNGVINANFTTGSRTLFLKNKKMTNNNLMEATNNGILAINGITITQGANGSILASGGNVTLTAAAIIGGNLNGGNFTIVSNSSLTGVGIAANTTVIISPAVILKYTGSTLVNNGTIQIDTQSSNASLSFTGNTTLSGTGTIFLDDWNPSARIDGPANATLTIGAQQTIHGIGDINANIVNNGSIIGDSNTGTHTLTIAGHAVNNGLIKATATGIVAFGPSSIVSANGTFSGATFQIDANSSMSSADAIVTNTATILFNGPNSAFNGLANLANNAGNLTVQNGSTVGLNGPVTNSGSIALTGANSTLTVAGAYTQTTGSLTGNGTFTAGSLFGNITANATMPINVAPNGGSSGTSKLTSLTITGGTSAWTGELNIANNKLILEPTAGTKATVLSTLRDQVIYGLTHSTGIVGTIPAKFGMAVADNAALSTPFTTFGGQPVDSNSLLVSAELLGDSDLSGKVDLTDLSTVLNNFGSTTPAWTSGNFDNAATIDLTDLSDVLNNFGATNANASVGGAGTAIAAPEPGALAFVGAPLLLARWRRKSRSS